jgi:hypothetical protein
MESAARCLLLVHQLMVSFSNFCLCGRNIKVGDQWTDSNPNRSDLPAPPEYVAATGGTVTCCGDYKIHTFTGPGTFTVTSVLVIL